MINNTAVSSHSGTQGGSGLDSEENSERERASRRDSNVLREVDQVAVWTGHAHRAVRRELRYLVQVPLIQQYRICVGLVRGKDDWSKMDQKRKGGRRSKDEKGTVEAKKYGGGAFRSCPNSQSTLTSSIVLDTKHSIHVFCLMQRS
jgi:hypothetical protein